MPPRVDKTDPRSLRAAIRRLTGQIKWRQKRREQHRRQVKRLQARRKPRIITAAQLGLRFQYIWGAKGRPYRGAGHYTAGARCKDATALAAEIRSVHAYHAGKGWGGISYEALIADDGTIGLANPVDRMSAGVGGQNTGLVNVCCPGTTGDRMTAAQKRSVAWLLDHWHTRRIPAAHRLPRPARELGWLGHKEYPGQSTACPGDMLDQYHDLWRAK